MPDGWYDYNRAKGYQLYNEFFFQRLAPGARPITFVSEREIGELMDEWHEYVLNPLLRYGVASIPVSIERATQSQTKINLAILALGLERYRRAHDNEYPETLNKLSPDYLPTDWIIPDDLLTGDPLLYRRVDIPAASVDTPAQSTYLLYAVGPNLTDDGGTVYAQKDYNDFLRPDRRTNDEHGDWVWPTPAMTIEHAP